MSYSHSRVHQCKSFLKGSRIVRQDKREKIKERVHEAACMYRDTQQNFAVLGMHDEDVGDLNRGPLVRSLVNTCVAGPSPPKCWGRTVRL
jgi:hypothetical protein